MHTLAEKAFAWAWNKLHGGAELAEPNNFLKLKIGQLLNIGPIMYRVVEVNILTEKSRGEDYHIVEYVVVNSSTLDKSDVRYHLWVYPAENKDDKYLILLFENTFSANFESARANGLVDAIKDPAGLTINEDADEPGLYVRRFGDTESHKVRKKILTSTFPRETEMSYWDYEYKEGTKTEDYLFVTESAEGWFNLLEGNQISYEDIII